LIDADAVRQDPDTGRYQLGTTIIEIAVAALGNLDSVKLGTQALKEVTDRTGLASVLAIWGANGPTAVRWEYGGLGAAIRIQEGGVLPLLTTAVGKVFLAYLPAEQTAPLVEKELSSQATSSAHSRKHLPDVERLRMQTLQDGVGRADGEQNPGFAALAAPVFGSEGRLVMALSLVSIKGVADMSAEGVSALNLREVAADLSRKLGGSTQTHR
jgi:DNA-binding IclR family transcriptional regulator